MKVYWGDFHTNMHSHHLDDYQKWYDFAKEMVDVWGPVYYPYKVAKSDTGFGYEAQQDEDIYIQDFEKLRQWCMKNEDKQLLVYLSYEWQGNGQDGDHNVFFKNHSGKIAMPKTYLELVKELENYDVMGIPHHPGYMPGHRGKNWNHHDEKFSPVVEIYSSHGSSESSDCSIPLNVHIHMGPRAEQGCYLSALKKGIHVGAIASGDNHIYPTISGNGFMGILSDKFDRESIFEAIRKRHTYAITRNKIDLRFKINEGIMGDIIPTQKENELSASIVAGSAIDRVELYKNGEVEKVFLHTGLWKKPIPDKKVRFKFEIELGWGPDRRVFEDIGKREWKLNVKTKGQIKSIEKLWTSPGCSIDSQTEKEFSASITTRKEFSKNGKLSQKNYLTPQIQNQSVIVEIEDELQNDVLIQVDDEMYQIPIADLLEESQLFAKEKEVEELLKTRYQFTEFYREDAWWHNAYKILVHRAYPSQAYEMNITYPIAEVCGEEENYFIKVIQKNGDTAWTSPIWIHNKKEEE